MSPKIAVFHLRQSDPEGAYGRNASHAFSTLSVGWAKNGVAVATATGAPAPSPSSEIAAAETGTAEATATGAAAGIRPAVSSWVAMLDLA